MDIVHEIAAQRVRGFGTSIFTEMSRLAGEHNAVNLGQGFPDFPGPDFVKEAAKKAIDANANQYAVSFGSPRLRQEIAQAWCVQTGQQVNVATEITVTTGATEAIFDVMQAFTDVDDEVVVFEPFYDSYPASAAMAGSRLRPITLRAPDWSFDPAEAEAAFGPRTKTSVAEHAT
jgi:N-succinyldiaminopimelate aminotransferase